MKSILYLFNGTGWGDHFLAIPFIKRHIEKYGEESLLVITYQKHIDSLFTNIEGVYLGLEKPDFCYKLIEKEVLNFKPDRIICFNAFNGFDFDCHVQKLYTTVKYYGTYTIEGFSIRHPYKEYSHTRDQYFLLPEEVIDYSIKDRQLVFSDAEILSYKNHFKLILEEFETGSTVIIHMDSEPRKLWDSKSWYLTLRMLIDHNKKVLIVGNNRDMINTYIKYIPEIHFIDEADIRKVFWLFTHYKNFIGIDSVFAHIADSYELNGIVLFSDYPLHEWRPVSKNMTTVCPEKGKLTNAIPLEQVKEVINLKIIKNENRLVHRC